MKRDGGVVSCPSGSSCERLQLVAGLEVRQQALLLLLDVGSSRPSTYAARNPRNVITVPDAENSASRPVGVVVPRRSETVSPLASAICEATVRFQIRS